MAVKSGWYSLGVIHKVVGVWELYPRLPRYRGRATLVARKKSTGTTAALIMVATDESKLRHAIAEVLSQGGAIMFGQTRDNEKLIVTTYIDGDKDAEYCEDAEEFALSLLTLSKGPAR